MGLTVSDGHTSALAWRDLYVVDEAREIGTERAVDRWSGTGDQTEVVFAEDTTTRLANRNSVRADVNPYGGGRVMLAYAIPGAGLLSGMADVRGCPAR